MNLVKIRMLVVLGTSLLVSGCGTFDGISYDKNAGIAKLSNAERTLVVSYDRTLKRCLEGPGPATLLADSSLDLDLEGDAPKLTNAKMGLLLKNTESIANLYTVSSVLQYTHAMAYRLCEATLNEYITGKQYLTEIQTLMQHTNALLTLQLEKAKEDAKRAKDDREKVEAQLQLEKMRTMRSSQ